MKLLTLFFLLFASQAFAQANDYEPDKAYQTRDTSVITIPKYDVYDICRKCNGEKVISGYFACIQCHGRGRVDCSKCGGTGMTTGNYNDGQGSIFYAPHQCPRTEPCIYCDGQGKVFSQKGCSYCNYSGRVKRK